MTIKDFIEKAEAGGWEWSASPTKTNADMFLDPLAWKAVGKVDGWKECPADLHPAQCQLNHYTGWLWKMRSMIDALAEGKTIEQYLETL